VIWVSGTYNRSSATRRGCAGGFPHGCVGQAYGLEVVFGSPGWADIDFNLNNAGIYAVNRGALGLKEHLSIFLAFFGFLGGRANSTGLPLVTEVMFLLNPAGILKVSSIQSPRGLSGTMIQSARTSG